MMRNGTPQISSFKKTLAMLEAAVADGGQSTVSDIARRLEIPIATAHRQIATLVAVGYLAPIGKGRHVAGGELLNLAQGLDEKQIIVNMAAPIVNRLSTNVKSIVQLGTLENDMVTYRIKTGRGSKILFTRIGLQLEAYCSAIGKILLAFMPTEQQEAYLASGPFVALTPHTITDPNLLRDELRSIRAKNVAYDKGEIASDLRCVAMPVRRRDGSVLAAISISLLNSSWDESPPKELLAMLEEATKEIEQKAFGRPPD